MITPHLHNETHIALESDYRHKEPIKALATYPDVRWCKERRMWLLDVDLLQKLYFFMGDDIAPASADFWMECPLPKPRNKQAAPRRRTKRQYMAQKRQEQEAAGRFGTAIVELMHKEGA